MLFADSLVVVGMAIASLGTIHESDGPRQQSFWLRNAGTSPAILKQGYTSCGCTTINFDAGATVQPGDSTMVTLRFNPRGKGGEFHEVATIVYGPSNCHVQMELQGECITSEETLMRQFPIRLNDSIRLSANRFDLGVMYVGQKKERGVVVLHREDHDRQERIPVVFSPDATTPKGLQHIAMPVAIRSGGRTITTSVVFDVLIK